MMALLAQLLVVSGKQAKQEPAAMLPSPVYRPFCPDCNDEGRDARHPCPGH